MLAAVVYLWFLGVWGLNYRRLPLEAKLEFDQRGSRRTRRARLGELAVERRQRDYAPAAHAGAVEARRLEAAFAAAQRHPRRDRAAVPGVPKKSLLGYYFRSAAIDGMTDPLFLEIIVNPDVLPFERPFVIAHEWAHLAGYANEAEANFVAWLTCVQGDALARYSGWLAVYEHVWSVLPRADRAALAAQLERRAARRICARCAARYETSTPVVRNAARDVYDWLSARQSGARRDRELYRRRRG